MCPFLVVGQRSDGVWGLTVRVATHNHPPISPDAHPSLRRLGPAQRKLLSSLIDIGVKPRHIVAQLQQSHSALDALPLLPRNIYNACLQLKLQQLNGCTPIQSLLTEFATDDFVSQHMLDIENRVTHLFFASRQSLELYNLYPDVPLLARTYKTNKYGLPLLNIVGITSVKTSFLVCCSFIPSESEANFGWVLQTLTSYITNLPSVVVTDCDSTLMNTLNRIFPTSAYILCRWHVRSSIYTRTKTRFSSRRTLTRIQAGAATWNSTDKSSATKVTEFMENWDSVVFSASVATYRVKWRDLQRRHWRDTALIDYL
jgi:hypothetical protein